MVFIETTNFSDQRQGFITDEELRAIQNEIQKHPERGDLIRGSGGLRKLRAGVQGRGKRGGARVIYYYAMGDQVVYLLDIYSKSDRESLSRSQLKAVKNRLEENR